MTTAAQKRATKKHRERKKAAGICVTCTKEALQGVYCAEHAAINRARSLVVRADRVPTFDDFCRLEPE